MTWGGLRKGASIGLEEFLIWTGQRMSLAWKLAAPVLVSTVILVGVMGAIVTNKVQAVVDVAYDSQTVGIASAVDAIYLQFPYQTPQMNAYLAQLVRRHPNLVAVRIVSLDQLNTVLASSKASEVGTPAATDHAEKLAVWAGRTYKDEGDGTNLDVVSPLNDSAGTLFGAIVITMSLADELAASRDITQTILGVGLIALVIDSLMVLSALYLGIIRRTRRVHRAVEAVGEGDTSVRLSEAEWPRGRDEIFNLARSVGLMIKSLDERQRGETLIRGLIQQALQGAPSSSLITSAVSATRTALHLETCIFATVAEDVSVQAWLDENGTERKGSSLPVWLSALARVAVEARRAVVSDRQGQGSRFAEGPGVTPEAQAAIVPLPRTSKAGQALVAVAPPGEKLPDGTLAVLDAVAATVAESLHLQAAEAARAESAAKSKVMAAVSHEMRNPLNSVLGFTGLLMASAGNLTEKQRQQLGHVQTSATNMLNLVNNYLDLAKFRSGAVTVQYEDVDLAALVEEVTELMSPIAAKRAVAIHASVQRSARSRLDVSHVRQLLTNLLSNAIKFTPEGGHVYIRARVDGDTCRLVVSDTGVGIARDQAALVFTEFSKIDAGPLAANKGTGLGLPLCKAFVAAMHGTIRLYSRRGRGTTFVVKLPAGGVAGKRARAA